MDDTTASHDTSTSPPPDSGQTATDAHPRLQRYTRKAVLGGVCAGLGRHLRVDPLLFRIAFIVLAFTGGVGIVAYVIAWLIIPGDDGEDPGEEIRRAVTTAPTWLQVVGVVVIALVVAGQLSGVPYGLAWAVVLIGAGIVLYRDSERTEPRDEARGPKSEAPPAPPPPFSAAPPPPPPFSAPPPPPPSYSAGPPPEAPPLTAEPAPPARPSRPRSILGRLTIAAILVACGVAALLDNAGVISWEPRQYVATATAITGIGLLIGAWWGRARALIFLGIAFLPLLLLAGFPTGPISSGIGERTHEPESVSELASGYELFAGEMGIDLSGLELDGDDVAVDISVGFGQLHVIVPPDVDLTVEGRVLAGRSDVLGRVTEGVGVTHERHVPGTGRAGSLTLHIDLGAGQFTVRQPR